VDATAKETQRFFDILTCSPILGLLNDIVPDPEADEPTKRFYLMLRGDPSPAKKDTLNACLVFYAQALKKVGHSEVQPGSHPVAEVAMAEYQPNTLEKIHKQLFAEFRQNSIYIQQRDFKHYGSGSYKAYWKTRMAATVAMTTVAFQIVLHMTSTRNGNYATRPTHLYRRMTDHACTRMSARTPAIGDDAGPHTSLL
jgi:hypothetical protein